MPAEHHTSRGENGLLCGFLDFFGQAGYPHLHWGRQYMVHYCGGDFRNLFQASSDLAGGLSASLEVFNFGVPIRAVSGVQAGSVNDFEKGQNQLPVSKGT